ncbi:MAG: histidine phosphatase family protein [Gammaproteobacteria bacterium]|jgi:probable phosphoglycerate mutase|nr:histidine phosphatase family protein [Gammaproteobacteria bacterium]
MALLLIRHGETDLNAARVVQFPDTPLGECGRLQVEQLALSLTARSIELVLTSDYERAKTTAQTVASRVGAGLSQSPYLRERHFGEIRGRSYESLGDVDIFAPDYLPPGGESWDAFDARMDIAWDEIVSHARAIAGDLAVVTHGLVLRSFLERKLDASDHSPEPETVVANTSVTVVEQMPPWRVVEFASVDHLEAGANDVAPV